MTADASAHAGPGGRERPTWANPSPVREEPAGFGYSNRAARPMGREP